MKSRHLHHFPRVLVGILYSNEPQLPLLVRSILNQDDVGLGYFIVSGRSKRDAHNILYGLFSRYQAGYDVLAKLDADMVIQEADLFNRIAGHLSASSESDHLMLPVFDYFTASEILGANFFRAGSFRFSQRRDNLFTDRMLSDMSTTITSLGFSRPVLHCPDPTDFQAYHFGVHRGIKLRYAIRNNDGRYARNHFRTLQALAVANRKRPTRQRALAYYALTRTLAGKFDQADVSYTVPTVKDDFLRTTDSLTAATLLRTARIQRVRNSACSLRVFGREARLRFDRAAHSDLVGRFAGNLSERLRR